MTTSGIAPATLGLKGGLTLAGRRFNAWWEGYAFDEVAERARIAAATSEGFQGSSPAIALSSAIWGDGRVDPGDPSWTMRLARTVSVPLRANVAVLGAGLGGPLTDLRRGTRWRVSGYSRDAAERQRNGVMPYDLAVTRTKRKPADGALCFFDIHRDPDPGAVMLFASELLAPGAPFSAIDFTVARRSVRLRSSFEKPWSGAPRPTEQVTEMLEAAGFRVADVADETRAFIPVVVRGWSRWRQAYDLALSAVDPRQRAHLLSLLSAFAAVWADRLDAMKAGHLQVTRFAARKVR